VKPPIHLAYAPGTALIAERGPAISIAHWAGIDYTAWEAGIRRDPWLQPTGKRSIAKILEDLTHVQWTMAGTEHNSYSQDTKTKVRYAHTSSKTPAKSPADTNYNKTFPKQPLQITPQKRPAASSHATTPIDTTASNSSSAIHTPAVTYIRSTGAQRHSNVRHVNVHVARIAAGAVEPTEHEKLAAYTVLHALSGSGDTATLVAANYSTPTVQILAERTGSSQVSEWRRLSAIGKAAKTVSWTAGSHVPR